MSERDHLAELSSVVASYLSTLQTLSECVSTACPAVGEPYRKHIAQLRARMAFDANPQTFRDGAKALEAELKDYAQAAGGYLAEQGYQLRRGIASLTEALEGMSRRQEFYGSRLRHFAAQMESTDYPSDAQQLNDLIALQVAGLRDCIDSMTHESASMLAKMRTEMRALDERLAGTHTTDHVTGLINRKEMLRQIEAHHESGTLFSLLQFQASGPGERPLSQHVMRQVAERLAAHFRHHDRIARWNEQVFLVLFYGGHVVAQERASQVLPAVAGTYTHEDGSTLSVYMEAHLAHVEQPVG